MFTISFRNWFANFVFVLVFVGLILPFSFVLADTSASVQSLSPGATDKIGNEVTFDIVSSGFNGFVSYNVTDSLSGSSVSNGNINSNGVFTWIPTSSDVGTHNLTVSLSDQSGNTASVSEQLIVSGPPTVSIGSLSPGSSIDVGQTVFFSASASGFTNPQYSVTDSVMTSSLTPSAINSSGGFSWTPKSQDVGGHNITVIVSDSLGDSANSTVNINVGVATSTIQSLSPGSSVFPGQNVTFTVVPTGFTNPTYNVNDSFYGGSVGNSNINYNGNFSWTPNQNDVGAHNISITVSDSTGNSSTVWQQIIVSGTGLSIGSISPGTTITPGTTFAFIATTSGFTSQSYYSVSDLFNGTSISNNNITSGGIFSWTPLLSDVGVHTITVSTLDNFGRSVRGSVVVTVNPTSVSAYGVSAGASGGTVSGGSTVAHTFLTNLNIGSTGADVTTLQTILSQKGFFSGPISGYFGALTAAAVKKFQTANGVSPLGNVGPATRAALNGLQSGGANSSTTSGSSSTSIKYTFSNPLSVGSTGADVTALQNRLTAEGVYFGPITGTFGPLTRAAVEKYQTAHGLSPVGQVGPAPHALLNE